MELDMDQFLFNVSIFKQVLNQAEKDQAFRNANQKLREMGGGDLGF
jgi:hypothetical protein